MSRLSEFSEEEQSLIVSGKRTLAILAKIMSDRYPKGVREDMDLTAVMLPTDRVSQASKERFLSRIDNLIDSRTKLNGKDDDRLKTAIIEMLKDGDKDKTIPDAILEARLRPLKAMVQQAIDQLTPDLPTLDSEKEGVVIGLLGRNIFSALFYGDE